MKKITLLALVICLFAPLALACSDFVVKAKDGTVVNGRSMEFPIDLKSEVWIVPRGQHSQYGFLGIDAFGLKDTFVEGFNEKGLAMGGLMFAGAQYQQPLPGKSVPIDSLGAWILGNFATVAEVKAALPKVAICDSSIKKLKGLGMHIAVHDALGKNLVIEFIGGKVKVYDNPLGILTNRPEFDWQMTNLRNYLNLDAHDKKPIMLNGVKVEPAGVGSGMLGLPGDWTPPSRFVRLAYSVNAALPPKNATEAVSLAQHLLNVVDIPKGVIKESTPLPLVEEYGYAEWVVIKDLTNKVLYFKTYENAAWKSVDLKKFDLSPGAPRKSIAMDDKSMTIIDVSNSLK